VQLSSSPDETRFDEAVASHRRELLAHCYRMLGSPHDAEDALQEALVGAWKGWAGFEGRSSVRTWLFRIATNACLKHARRRPTRVLSTDLGPGFTQTADLGRPDTEHLFLEPWAGAPDDTGDPAAAYARREGVELAYVAALQHLPATQRAVLLLREVLQFSAAEVAELLDTSVAGVNSALQRARAAMEERTHGPHGRYSQQAELAALGEDGVRRLVEEFVSAWEASDVDRLAALLADDARFTMPPLPAWFDGREMVVRFLTERLFETPWRLEPRTINGQPGFLCHQLVDGSWQPGAVNVLSVRDGRVTQIAGFVDPLVVKKFAADR
jgi:RNA polymerase sigma-70 factor (TIGR02960 family)